MCHETHLGLGKSSEDRHQLLILGMVRPAERNVEDMDWFLMDVLAMRAWLSPFAPAQPCCHRPEWESSTIVPTLASSSP